MLERLVYVCVGFGVYVIALDLLLIGCYLMGLCMVGLCLLFCLFFCLRDCVSFVSHLYFLVLYSDVFVVRVVVALFCSCCCVICNGYDVQDLLTLFIYGYLYFCGI